MAPNRVTRDLRYPPNLRGIYPRTAGRMAQIPENQRGEFAIRYGVGAKATGKYDLNVRIPSKPDHIGLKGVPMQSGLHAADLVRLLLGRRRVDGLLSRRPEP